MQRVLLGILLAMAGTVGVSASDAVASVSGPDTVVVEYRDIPVAFGLAHIQVESADADAARARLEELVAGKEVSVIYKEGFGVDEVGTAKVHLKVGKDHVNQILVTEGLARYVDTGDGSTYARLLDMAQTRAKEDGTGLWGRPAVVAAAPEPAAAPAPAAEPAAAVAAGPKGPFCAEITGAQFYASDDPRVARLNQGKLIYYKSEADARRAGKRPAPAEAQVGSGGADDADRLLAEAKEVYSQAIAAGNTGKRDELYGEAFGKFTAALQIYSPLVEANPDDAALAEKLRETMQLRYGAMKQRRF